MGKALEKLALRIRDVAASQLSRERKAGQIAEMICEDGGWRWVGVYDVDEKMVSIIACSSA